MRHTFIILYYLFFLIYYNKEFAMKILVVGGGGREHAIIRALKKALIAAISGVPLATAALVTMPPAKTSLQRM